MTDRTLRDLHAAFLRDDPPPPRSYTAARAAFALLDLDARLAELTTDTALASAGLRSSTRLLTYTAGGTTLTLEVASTGRTRSLTGLLTPAVTPAAVTVRTPSGTHPAVLSPTGHFLADTVPTGLFMLHVAFPDGSTLVTNWTRI
ncbi:hypothetical protein GCM10027589_60030 [Actinocorallia lasiicapitis]